MDYGSREDDKITAVKVDAETEFATGFTVCVKPDSQFWKPLQRIWNDKENNNKPSNKNKIKQSSSDMQQR